MNTGVAASSLGMPVSVRARLDILLAPLASQIVLIRDLSNGYGTGYRTLRASYLLEKACELCELPIRKDTRAQAVHNGVTISQALLIDYINLGKNETLWNKRTKYKLAAAARDHLLTINVTLQNQIQAGNLQVLQCMLNDSFLALPAPAGAATTAATISTAALERRCNEVLGTTKGKAKATQ